MIKGSPISCTTGFITNPTSLVFVVLSVLIPWLGLTPQPGEAQVPRGSPASLDRQNEQARQHDFSYLRTPDEVRRLVDAGYLVPVRPNRDFDVHNVSFPYTRPEVRVFIERLASQYRSACNEKLVVTSLTRPLSNQPRNASSRSVHPTGMAVDLRRPVNTRCRNWLESTLATLLRQGVIEVIYERNPPHYHVAVFPRPYVEYVARITGNTRVAAQLADAGPELTMDLEIHRVARGENLTGIASRYGTTVGRIQSENGLRGSTIQAGQELKIPVYRSAPDTRVATAPSVDAAEQRPAQQAVASLNEGEVEVSATPPSQTRSEPREASLHTVARGESLWVIARSYGVSEVDLRRLNGIAGSRIVPGQQLRLPSPGDPGTLEPLRHRVARGESLWTIARRYGTTIEEIRARNGMDTTRILAGQVLEVPVSR